MWLFVLQLILFILYASLLFFYRRNWLLMPVIQVDEAYHPKTRVSVIIAARNEEKNIASCLFSVAEQNYPPGLFEVIVVDDQSEDNTAAIVQRISGIYSNISCISLVGDENMVAYKKKAIATGISSAKGTLMVTTDADCIVPENWLKNIVAFYEKTNAVFIAAPVVMAPGKGLVKVFQSLDFLSLQGITGASVFAKFHTMCNGANLAYEKKVFEEVNGFAGVDDIASGDDMLLMYKIYLRYPSGVHYLKSREAIVQTAPVESWPEFFSQRIRWASKAGRYKDKRIFWTLLLVYLFNLSFPVIAIAAFFIKDLWIYLASFLLLKTLYELFFMTPVAKFFGKERLLWWFPLLQPLHIIYTVIAGLLGSFSTYTWKGRKVE